MAFAAQQEADKRSADYAAAATLTGQGDSALANDDYKAAAANYNAALAQYAVLGDAAQSAVVISKLQDVAVK